MTTEFWAVVSGTAPLTVRREHESVDLPAKHIGFEPPEGARVRCMLDTHGHVLVFVAPSSPIGVVEMFAGSAAPSGYLLCDGASYLRADYPALFAVIGTTFGAADGTHFNVPNMKGRVPVGRDSGQTEFDTLGETGGAKTHELTSAEMPSHTHTQNSHTHPAGGSDAFLVVDNGDNIAVNLTQRAFPSTSGSGVYFVYAPDPTAIGENANTAAATATNQNTGGGQAHNNLQPFTVLNYIIRA